MFDLNIAPLILYIDNNVKWTKNVSIWSKKKLIIIELNNNTNHNFHIIKLYKDESRAVDRKCICGFQLHFYLNFGPFIFCWFSYKSA